jgi:hypothetical protein
MKMLCPHCGQALPETRLGVRLTPLKASIFDLVKRAGPDGILSSELQARIGTKTRASLKSHIWQINDAIGEVGYRIVNDRMRLDGGSCYNLLRRPHSRRQ